MIELKTEEKLNVISSKFPNIEQDSLLELLIACNGDIQGTVDLISLQFPIVSDSASLNSGGSPVSSDVIDGGQLSNGIGDINDKSGLLEADEDVFIESLYEDNKPETITIKEQEEICTEPDIIQTDKTEILEPRTLLKRKLQPVNDSIQQSKKPKPTLKYPGKTVTLYTKEEIETAIPQVRIISNFLPTYLSNAALKELLSKTPLFKHNEFYIAGTKCKSSHKTAIFMDELHKDRKYDDEFYQSGGPRGSTNRQFDYSTNLKMIRYMIEEEVNKILNENNPAKFDFQVQENWKAMLCVANYFEDNKKHLDWHSDKLTNIGPLPLICSLTLGATRLFRLKKIYKSKTRKTNDNVIYNIPLSHNMLLIMLPGCQEEFKHCVPTLTDSLHQTNKISGDIRFNLTFRMFHLKIASNNPSCPICKKHMILRRMYKNYKTRGFYFWMCQSTYLGMNCKGFYYGKFDQINNPEDCCVFTTDISEASRWISEDDGEALEYRKHLRLDKQLFDMKMVIREETCNEAE